MLERAADDPAAFGAFYEQHAQRLLVFLTRRVLNVEVALDLMSETFAVALERCRDFRGSTPDEELGWLYAIARSQLSHFWRDGDVERRALQRLGLEAAHLTDPEIERVEQLAGIADLAAQANGAIAKLPSDQQDALRLRVVDELDYSVIASQLGISEQAVRARVSRGLRTLASELDPPEPAKDVA